MNFEFTIIEEGQHYGRRMWKQMAPIKPYPPTGSRESWVYRIASALAGHPITRAEADKFTTSDINGYIHQQVRITISESAPKENGKRYNNLDSFLSVKQQLPLFDETKVPKENQPEPKNEVSSYERLKATAESLNMTKQPATEQITANTEKIASDIQEMAEQMADEDIAEDIPF